MKTDVRVVAATNVNLLTKVSEGRFREDLYYRLNSVPIYVPPLREREKDVELLFRKFATDFAEKYKVKPIALTEEAKSVLLKYRFPGNIRQLKNLVEQISVLSPDLKEIDGITLSNYLPKESTLPAVINGKNGSDISEREILYKVLFDLKKDVTEVKKMVLEILSDPDQAQQILKNNTHLFEGIQDTKIQADQPVMLNINPVQTPPVNEEEEVHDISHEAEDDSLSIQKKEKELIVRALSKNKNKRKYAAQDLGISERTLYRKIKEYDLEK
jgi:transcriptional regulator with PAS, ATPase and Fis domain